MKKVSVVFVAALIGGILCSAQAGVVTLSKFSSDSTPAEDLDAIIEFSVTDSTLTIEVSNLTDGPDDGEDTGFNINSIYFNATNNVTALMLTSPTGWTLYTSSNDTRADGFGQFDYALIDGVGNDPDQIEGETSKSFALTVDGSGFSASDFHTELSSAPPGEEMLVAAKFVSGPDDDSAFGAVPEPTMVALLGLGTLGLLRKRKHS
jgi:hypothetical protein